jgi:hypothetical protein
MLPFTFADLDSTKAASQEKNGVQVTLHPPKRDVKIWAFSLDLRYPPGGPVFESFEDYWLRANELSLITPDGKRLPVGKVEINGMSLTYRLEETERTGPLPKELKGWKAEFMTPAPLREFKVPFRLKDIELP